MDLHTLYNTRKLIIVLIRNASMKIHRDIGKIICEHCLSYGNVTIDLDNNCIRLKKCVIEYVESVKQMKTVSAPSVR